MTTTTTNATINATVAATTRVATPINALGLQEYDLVKTSGKGIGIVLRKKSLNDELVIYSISSASVTHPTDDDGMAKVRRYNADGTIATHSEKTGKKLKNRDIYTITGIKSYANPVLAMKDFINQNDAIEFDPVVVPVVEETVDTTEMTTDDMFKKLLAALDGINNKLDDLLR